MKRLIPLLGISLFCLAASAQPTSFGGITPGKTSREELKSLVQKSDEVGIENKNDINVKLKQPDGMSVMVKLQNDVVYQVMLVFSVENEMKSALIEKYGRPKITGGNIKSATYQNKFGASFEGFIGRGESKWPVKDGVQGALLFVAPTCMELPGQGYVLYHVATVETIENNRAEEKRRKLGDAF
jgi:hypothetical protein